MFQRGVAVDDRVGVSPFGRNGATLVLCTLETPLWKSCSNKNVCLHFGQVLIGDVLGSKDELFDELKSIFASKLKLQIGQSIFELLIFLNTLGDEHSSH